MSESLQPKVVYEPVSKLEAFYTGGAVRVTRDNKHIACACGDEVKVTRHTVAGPAMVLTGNCKSCLAHVSPLSWLLHPNRNWQQSPASCGSSMCDPVLRILQVLDVATGSVAKTLSGVSFSKLLAASTLQAKHHSSGPAVWAPAVVAAAAATGCHVHSHNARV
eukprot:GHRR01030666.1.p1 GENE.GHRR01030666.1~~GHRR01030666.1.p1  ORF type:complete len:163 (+),score=25.97 GHRR01030666.1:365-853(+)